MGSTNLNAHTAMLASIRTFLSYVRTTLVCFSVAFASMQLNKTHPIDDFTILMFTLSGVFLVLGILTLVWTIIKIKNIKNSKN